MDSASGILHRDSRHGVLVDTRCDRQVPVSLGAHRFYCIHREIEKNLLQLNTVADNFQRLVGHASSQQYLVGFQFSLNQGNNFTDEDANIQAALFAGIPTKHCARACNYLVYPVTRSHDLLEVRFHLR